MYIFRVALWEWLVQSLWLHDVKMMKSISIFITSERQDHAAASAGAEMQPSPKKNHPAHFLLETSDLSVTAGFCLEVIVAAQAQSNSILLAENTNQHGQATGDMLRWRWRRDKDTG